MSDSVKATNKSEITVEKIFESYKTDVFRFALAITRDTHLSEDITQDVFLCLIQNIDKISDIRKIKSWLLTTTKNTAINVLRRRSFEVDETDTLLSATDKDNYQFELFSMLGCLDKTNQQIVVLHIVNGMKHKEIARIIDMKPGTVRQRYVRSLRLIKQNLTGEMK